MVVFRSVLIYRVGSSWCLHPGAHALSRRYETMHLTPREKEVLDLLLSGRTNKEIAELMCISTFTVRDHVSTLLRKGRARNRMELSSSRLLPAWVDMTLMEDAMASPRCDAWPAR